MLVGTFCIAVADDSFNHATKSDASWLDVTAPHLLPTSPHSINVSCTAICLDKAAKCVRPSHGNVSVALQLLQLGSQQVRLADAHTSLATPSPTKGVITDEPTSAPSSSPLAPSAVPTRPPMFAGASCRNPVCGCP